MAISGSLFSKIFSLTRDIIIRYPPKYDLPGMIAQFEWKNLTGLTRTLTLTLRLSRCNFNRFKSQSKKKIE